MKKYMIVVLFIIVSCTGAPEILNDQPQVFEYPGISQAKLYQKSLEWLAYGFKPTHILIRYRNAAQGRIVSKVTLSAGMAGFTENDLTIDVKPGRARILCKPTGYVSPDGKSKFGMYDSINGIANELITYTYDEYDKFMKTDSSNKDW